MILYLGRINWKKNLIELVRAMSRVPYARLAIVGYNEDNHGREVMHTVVTLGLHGRITVLARRILGADKEALLAACDLLVLPSLSENFGNTVLESAIRGKPVVVSEGAGVASFVREHQCGKICKPTADSIALALTEVLRDPTRAREMGERARNSALRHYSWPVIAQRMSAAYDAAIHGHFAVAAAANPF